MSPSQLLAPVSHLSIRKRGLFVGFRNFPVCYRRPVTNATENCPQTLQIPLSVPSSVKSVSRLWPSSPSFKVKRADSANGFDLPNPFRLPTPTTMASSKDQTPQPKIKLFWSDHTRSSPLQYTSITAVTNPRQAQRLPRPTHRLAPRRAWAPIRC